jgi:YD repeat-containing protein
MVAILTGNGLGLERSSASVLGARGTIGGASHGRAGENVFVNATNGNLILNNRDELLIGRGPDSAINRTYNSLGQLDGDNNDNWRMSAHRRLFALTGSINAAGSTLKLLDWDGSEILYTYDASRAGYFSTEGAGAYDKIVRSGTGWDWIDGSGLFTERYEDFTVDYARIASRRDTERDANGNPVNAITYSYSGDKISRITTADGNYTDLIWSGNNLTQLTTTYTDTQTGQTKTLTRTRYTYSGNRLASVTTDLSPEDNSIADGRVYTTSYTYDANGRVLSIAQTDSTHLSFIYDGQGRVTSFTEKVDVGVTRTTSFAYGGGYTNVTDPQGNVTTLYYDGAGQLTQIAEPPASAGGPARVTDFVYYGTGDLYYTSTYEGSYFARTWYRYDGKGNLFDVYTDLPGQGYQVTRYYYGTKNELLTSTSYTGIDPDGHGGAEPTGGMTTRYIYDSETHLRFVASPEGRVTEYRYDAAGNRIAEIAYQLNTVGTAGLPENFSWSEQDYINWLASIGDKTTTSRTDTSYDFRGNVQSVTSYSKVDASGNGLPTSDFSKTIFVYDQYGSLLSKRTLDGGQLVSNTDPATLYDFQATVAGAPSINGAPARQYTVAAGQTYAGAYTSLSVNAGDTVSFSFAVQAVGSVTSQYFGIYGGATGWAPEQPGKTIARIVSGPGTLSQYHGGLWKIDGLSTTTPTKVEFVRTFDTTETAYPYVYVGYGTWQSGVSMIVGDTSVVKTSAATETYAYDGMGRMIRHTDAKGVGTWTSYIDTLNRTVTTLANGLTTTSVYNRAGELVASTEARGGVGSENLVSALGQMTSFALTSADVGTLDGANAIQYTLAAPQAGDSQHIRSNAFYAKTGDLVTATMSFKATSTSNNALIGLLGHSTGWGASNIISARIISGPGTIAEYVGGVWNVSGLSTTEATRVEITRAYTQDEAGDFRIYPDYVGAHVAGNSIIMSAPSLIISRYDPSAASGSLNASLFDINNWSSGGATREAAGTVGGSPAIKFTVQATSQWTGASAGIYAVAGDTITSAITLKGANGGTSASFGVYGNSTGWDYNNNHISSARIISGPGTLTQEGGGLWNITGLSDSQETRIEITRSFQTEESGGIYLYPNRPEGWIAGRAVIAGAPSVSKTAGATTTLRYDSLGRLRVSTDALGHKTYYVYDKRGRKTAEVSAGGELVEYRYDAADRVVAKIRYHYNPSAGQVANLADPNNTLTVDNLRTSADSGVWLWNVYDKAGRLIEEISGDGRVTTFTYDGANRLIETRKYVNLISVSGFSTTAPASLILPSAHAGDAVTRLFYDKDGNAIGALDAEGYLTESVYNGAGKLVEEIGYAQRTSSSYWASGTFDQLRSTAAPGSAANRRARHVYDSRGLLAYTVNAQGIATKFGYDAAGRVTETRVYATPISTSNFSFANVTALVNSIASGSNDRIATSTYDARGQVASSTDAGGLTTTFTYDAVGNVIKAVAGARTVRNWYTQRGQLRFAIDAEGYVTEHNYDARGQVVSTTRYETQTNIADGATAWAVAAAISADYAAGRYQRVRFGYDAKGQLVDTYDADNIRTNVWFRGNGEAGYVTVASGTVDQSDAEYFGYNASGQVTWKGEAWGETAGRGDEQRATSYYYDGLGNLTSVVDPRGVTTTYAYDKLGRVTSVTDANGGQVLYQYDAFGNQTAVRDARGYWTYNSYDNLGRLTQTTDASGVATTSVYNNFGELASVSRAGATTYFLYDKMGRVTRSTDALGFFETYAYDLYGNRTAKTAKSANANAVNGSLTGTTLYTYDRRGLLLTETLPMASYNADGGLVSSTVTNKFEYDAFGNRTKMIEAFGLTEARTTTYYYDKNNRLKQTTGQTFLGQTPNEYIYYDARGNVTSTVNAAGGRTVFYYDDLNRKTVEISAVGTYTKYTYDKNGNVTEIRVYETIVGVPADGGSEEEAPGAPGGNSRYTTFTYDNLNRMLTSSVLGAKTGYWNGSSWAQETSAITTQYQYDANGNVVKLTDPLNGTTFSYYDALGRKTAQVDAENYITTWTYNAEGNVLTEHRYDYKVPAPTSTTTAPTPTPNATNDRVTYFTYDLNGNRLSETRSTVLVHNGAGAHTTVQAAIYYAYNGLGQVVRKTEATGDFVDYVYDAAGRLTVESRKAYQDFTGAWVTPTVDYYYNGVNNLSRTRQRGSGDSAERVTIYGYDGDKLRWVADAEGNYRYYWYDQGGRQTYDYYVRYKSDGTFDSVNSYYDGNLTSYDVAGRVVSKWQAVYSTISGWITQGPVTQLTYNAFGDVIGTYVGGILQQQSQYDLAGRMIGTTSGDGIWKYFGYDKNGNQTVAINSAGTSIGGVGFDTALAWVGGEGVNASYTVYDKRNMARTVVEEGRRFNAGGALQQLTTTRTYTAFGEVESEINAAGALITYTYNTMGRMIRSESPAVEIVLENGAAPTVRPTEDYYYDASGRLVATRDANGSYTGEVKNANTGNLTILTLLTGTGYGGGQAQVSKETRADGSVWETLYDIHGDARATIDGNNSVKKALGQAFVTQTRAYDRMGRMVVAANGAGLVDYYAYDLLGQQIKHWNNYLGAYDVETTDYDIQGRVISQRGFGGDVTTISYAWENVQTNIGGTLTTLGGWLQTTWMANGLYSHERTDLFGRVTWKRDLGGYTTDYGYDVAGRMAWSSSNGMQVSFAWFNSGLQASVVSGNSNAGTVNTNWTRDTATYSYNVTGSRLTEYLVRETATYTPAYTYWYNQYEPEDVPESYYVSSAVIKNQTATYDALGRMKTWGEAGTATAPASNTTTGYDAGGNIRRTYASFFSLDANGNASAASTKEYWFRYDSLNRVVTNQGKLENGVIVRGAGSYGVSAGQDILYDASGQRAAVISSTLSYYGGYYGYGGTATTTDTRENYYYDAAGRLSSTYVAPDATSTGTIRTSISYDLMGRMSGQTDYEAGVAVYNRTAYYNSKGQLYYDAAWTKKDDNKTYSSTNYYYFTDYNNGQYMLGSVGWMQSTSSVSGTSGSTTSRTVNSYIWRDGAVQSGIQHKPNINQSLTYNTTFYLNQFGQLTGAYIADGKPRSVSYVLDELGQIIRRDETRPGNAPSGQVGSPHEVWYRFSGRQLGYTGNNGTSEVNFDASINERQIVAPTNAGTYRNGQLSGTTYADFAQNYDPINSYYQGAAGGTYRVQAGDSLQNIAQNLFGDSSLWYKIAEANGLSASAALIEGQTLVLPTGVTKSKNNAGTFKPYNAAEATGDLSPTQAKPPKKPKCGTFGLILLAVIAIAVTAITAGAALAAAAPGVGGFASGLSTVLGTSVLGGTVAAGGIAGALGGGLIGALGAVAIGAGAAAVGSVISQGVGVATGIQAKFSWKGVALAALSGGVGAGIGAVAPGGGWLASAGRAAASSTITQGIGVVTGLQDKFSWAGVAAAGIGAGVGHLVGDGLAGKGIFGLKAGADSLGNFAASTAAGAIANAATRSAINGESFGDNLLAAVPDVIAGILQKALGTAMDGIDEYGPIVTLAGKKPNAYGNPSGKLGSATPEGQAAINAGVVTQSDLDFFNRNNPGTLGLKIRRANLMLADYDAAVQVRDAAKAAYDKGVLDGASKAELKLLANQLKIANKPSILRNKDVISRTDITALETARAASVGINNKLITYITGRTQDFKFSGIHQVSEKVSTDLGNGIVNIAEVTYDVHGPFVSALKPLSTRFASGELAAQNALHISLELGKIYGDRYERAGSIFKDAAGGFYASAISTGFYPGDDDLPAHPGGKGHAHENGALAVKGGRPQVSFGDFSVSGLAGYFHTHPPGGGASFSNDGNPPQDPADVDIFQRDVIVARRYGVVAYLAGDDGSFRTMSAVPVYKKNTQIIKKYERQISSGNTVLFK